MSSIEKNVVGYSFLNIKSVLPIMAAAQRSASHAMVGMPLTMLAVMMPTMVARANGTKGALLMGEENYFSKRSFVRTFGT